MDAVVEHAARLALVDAARARGESLSALSRMLRRNVAYLQQYVARGTPRRLDERDRGFLAEYLGVSEEVLGAPAAAKVVAVLRLDVAASAGPGSLRDGDRVVAVDRFPAELLDRHGLAGRTLSMVVARGASMSPTIDDGDEMLVDTADRRVDARGGIYVLRIDGAVLVKRLKRVKGVLQVSSDNPDTPPVAPLAADDDGVVGRVVWLSRRLA